MKPRWLRESDKPSLSASAETPGNEDYAVVCGDSGLREIVEAFFRHLGGTRGARR